MEFLINCDIDDKSIRISKLNNKKTIKKLLNILKLKMIVNYVFVIHSLDQENI